MKIAGGRLKIERSFDLDLGVGVDGYRLDRLGGGFRDPVGGTHCARLERPGRRPPALPAIAIDEGPDQLAVRGDIRKRREVNS